MKSHFEVVTDVPAGPPRAQLLLAHALLICTQLFLSGWHIVSSLVLKNGADPVVFALYRELAASILMFGMVVARDIPIRVDRADYPRFGFLGCCSFVNVVFTNFALQYIAPTRYALFQPTIPCFAAVISMGIRLEPFSTVKSIGIVVAVAGAILVEAWKTSSANAPEESNVPLGVTLAVIQCIALASVIVFQKSLLTRYDPALLTFVYYSVGSLVTVLLALCLLFRFTWASFYFHGDWLPWVGILYASIFATFFAYNFIAWSGQRLIPSVTTVYSTLPPVGTTILSRIIFGTVLSLSEGIGGAVVILGLLITIYGHRREQSQESHYTSITTVEATDPEK